MGRGIEVDVEERREGGFWDRFWDQKSPSESGLRFGLRNPKSPLPVPADPFETEPITEPILGPEPVLGPVLGPEVPFGVRTSIPSRIGLRDRTDSGPAPARRSVRSLLSAALGPERRGKSKAKDPFPVPE